MKKIILSTLAAIFLSLVLVSPAAAQKADGSSCHDNSECASGNCDFAAGRVCAPASNSSTNFFEVTDERLDSLDPLRIGGSEENAEELSTPGGVISRLLSFIFPLAGIVLFIMIVVGGFQILLGGTNQKSMEAGRQRVTMAIVGFLLLFASYWIAQIIEQIFNIRIL